MITAPTRVLDFGNIDPFGRTIGRPRNLLWPVQAFRITLPSSHGSQRATLNAFESVVLEVLEVTAGLGDVQLADAVCLPVDLVRNVLSRLKDQELVNADNVVVARSRTSAMSHELLEHYSSALVFREMVTGSLLSFVYELSDVGAIVSGPISDGWRMGTSRETLGLGSPTPSDVLALVKKSRRRRRDHGGDTRFPRVSQIRVNNEPEHYYLDCPIAFRAFDGDFRIADPFGLGFSTVLERAFTERLDTDDLLGQWMTRWRETLASRAPGPGDASRSTASYATEENIRMFPGLVDVLSPARGRAHRSIVDIHAALEWAMYYCCEMHDPTAAIRSITQQSATAFDGWATGMAVRLGFEPPRQGLRKPTAGKMENYFREIPELETLCVLSLVQADGNITHPFRRVASHHPDFFGRLESLAQSRGAEGHGRSSASLRDVELESDGFMRDVVSTLLPTICFNGTPATATDSDRRALMILRARTSLLEAIDYRLFNALGPATQSALVAAEVAWLERADGEDARIYVTCFYAALQSVVRGVIDKLPFRSIEGDEFRSNAGRRSAEAGLGDIPEELSSVRQWRIRQAIDGNDLTLGAVMMAFLLVAPLDFLSDVADVDPALLTTVATVIKSREHANRAVIMDDVQLRSIREAGLFTIKNLLDLTE